MAEREGTLVGVWLSDEEIEQLDKLAQRLADSRLIARKNRSETIRSLVRIYDEDEVVNKLVMEVIAHTQADAPNGKEIAVLA